MKLNQCERIVRHLYKYGTITSAEAMSDYGIYRLASRINDLKKKGYMFQVDIIQGVNRFGEPTHFAQYSFLNEVI